MDFDELDAIMKKKKKTSSKKAAKETDFLPIAVPVEEVVVEAVILPKEGVAAAKPAVTSKWNRTKDEEEDSPKEEPSKGGKYVARGGKSGEAAVDTTKFCSLDDLTKEDTASPAGSAQQSPTSTGAAALPDQSGKYVAKRTGTAVFNPAGSNKSSPTSAGAPSFGKASPNQKTPAAAKQSSPVSAQPPTAAPSVDAAATSAPPKFAPSTKSSAGAFNPNAAPRQVQQPPVQPAVEASSPNSAAPSASEGRYVAPKKSTAGAFDSNAAPKQVQQPPVQPAVDAPSPNSAAPSASEGRYIAPKKSTAGAFDSSAASKLPAPSAVPASATDAAVPAGPAKFAANTMGSGNAYRAPTSRAPTLAPDTAGSATPAAGAPASKTGAYVPPANRRAAPPA